MLFPLSHIHTHTNTQVCMSKARNQTLCVPPVAMGGPRACQRIWTELVGIGSTLSDLRKAAAAAAASTVIPSSVRRCSVFTVPGGAHQNRLHNTHIAILITSAILTTKRPFLSFAPLRYVRTWERRYRMSATLAGRSLNANKERGGGKVRVWHQITQGRLGVGVCMHGSGKDRECEGGGGGWGWL